MRAEPLRADDNPNLEDSQTLSSYSQPKPPKITYVVLFLTGKASTSRDVDNHCTHAR